MLRNWVVRLERNEVVTIKRNRVVSISGFSSYTQEQLAEKCGTTKNYISRIENNASDIRLSTLIRIFREGFGRNLKLSIG